MSRRRWPAWLALLSVLILGSFLVVTEWVVREIRRSTELHTRMYAHVQEGLLDPDAELRALVQLQQELVALGVPIVALNADGEPLGAQNLPFAVDITEPADWPRIVAYAARLDRNNPPLVTASGSIHFGEPPILRWLRWVPWLQVSGGLTALLIAAVLLRTHLRAERERTWAAMARELAHQMGTPLSSLAGWVELLRMPAPEREELVPGDRIAGHIAADVERLERVSRRFELIGKAPAVVSVELDAVLAELDAYLRPRLPRFGAGVEFRARIRGRVPPVRANPVLLVWALENLVKNALDALAGRGGRIRVVVRTADDGWVWLAVADNGPGIPPAVRDRIFDAGVSTKSGGWGVGLSLTRRIIESYHGGRITVRARRGGGTVFEVRLPAAGPVPAPRTTVRAAPDPAPAAG